MFSIVVHVSLAGILTCACFQCPFALQHWAGFSLTLILPHFHKFSSPKSTGYALYPHSLSLFVDFGVAWSNPVSVVKVLSAVTDAQERKSGRDWIKVSGCNTGVRETCIWVDKKQIYSKYQLETSTFLKSVILPFLMNFTRYIHKTRTLS